MPLRLAAALALAALLVGCTGDGEGVPPTATAEQTTAGDASAAPDAGQEPVTAEPAVALDGRCTQEPRTGDAGPYVTARATVENTGNIGARVRVTAAWPQGNGRRVEKSRLVRVDVDDERQIRLRLDLAETEAAAIADAAAAGRTCRLNHRVNGAFGEPVVE